MHDADVAIYMKIMIDDDDDDDDDDSVDDAKVDMLCQ